MSTAVQMKSKILIASARGTRRQVGRGYHAETFTLELVTQSADGSTTTKSFGAAVMDKAPELLCEIKPEVYRYEPRDRSEAV